MDRSVACSLILLPLLADRPSLGANAAPKNSPPIALGVGGEEACLLRVDRLASVSSFQLANSCSIELRQLSRNSPTLGARSHCFLSLPAAVKAPVINARLANAALPAVAASAIVSLSP